MFTLSQALVGWHYILQSTVILSTMKIEYMAITKAMKKAIWLLNDLEIDQDLLEINCDSISVIYLAKNQVYHASTIHIDVRFHFV